MASPMVRFTDEHEWVAVEDGSDVATVGITGYAAGELGDIVFVELPEVGSEFKQTDSLGTIEAVKTVTDLYAPVTGAVVEINPQLEDNPEVINQSPLEDGWFLKIRMADRSELDGLMTQEQYDEMIGK